jgi:uncharacterized paraquat-inducible protein A
VVLLVPVLLLFTIIIAQVSRARKNWIKYKKSDGTAKGETICPVCNEEVSKSDLKCPVCGVEFMPDQNEKIDITINL